ncbi:MAG: hypothetical protein KC505_03155 [Myxococcales bacterium]|nr:hypothetical protein [Myxococcales bacterium]USN51406.1 MAG: hypothetical protein H6731_03075 [Myxococcales bacterium]
MQKRTKRICAGLFISFALTSFSSSVDSNLIHKNYRNDTVADFLFRYQIFRIDSDGIHVIFDKNNYLKHKDRLESLWQKLDHDSLPCPLELEVFYSDSYKSKPTNFVDSKTPYVCHQTEHMESINDYFKHALYEVEDQLSHGYEAPSLTWQEVQETSFIKRETLSNEQVRICGMTEKIEELLLSHLIKHLKANKIDVQHMYYFGSRVMPRTEVLKRDKRLLGKLPINDNGVVKNSVRIKGFTAISDLEIALLFSGERLFLESELKEIFHQFKQNFETEFREFPVSLKFIQMTKNEAGEEPFQIIYRHYSNERNKLLSKYQFVEIPKEIISGYERCS